MFQTPDTSPFHPKYYFDGHQCGQEYVKNSELQYYWLYIGVVWVKHCFQGAMSNGYRTRIYPRDMFSGGGEAWPLV